MRKYHLMVLPVALLNHLNLPPFSSVTGSGKIEVTYPGGNAQLAFRKDPTRPVTHLFFSGNFSTWFNRNLQEGDQFFVDIVVKNDPEAPHGLRFGTPGTAATGTTWEPVANLRVVPVRPDWTDNRSLLGYYNPLTQQYTTTPFLDLIFDARHEFDLAKREVRIPVPFFVILDEMNLARVEHYFSDFLSCLESGEAIELHSELALETGANTDGDPIPRRLSIPENLFFTGTVNVDETTSMFSPKVLDRAFTIELNEVDLDGYGKSRVGDAGSVLRLKSFPDSLRWERTPNTEDWKDFSNLAVGALRDVIVRLNQLLEADHRHFGYRVANEIARFVCLASQQADSEPSTLWAALDLAILHKVLPKFHGTQQELEAQLRQVFAFAVAGKVVQQAEPHQSADKWGVSRGHLSWSGSAGNAPANEPRLPRVAVKVWHMLRRLREQGFTSFIE